MKNEMTSKERILATIERKPIDHIPLCFEGICHGVTRFLINIYPDPYKRALYYLDLGIDTGIRVQMNWGINPEVKIREWTEKHENEDWLIKEYITEKGKLQHVVRKSIEYPHDTIPLFSDHNVPPGRIIKYLVSCEEDLDKLECLFGACDEKDVNTFYEHAKEAKKFCERHGIVLTAYLQGVGDPLIWLSGVENLLFAAIDEPTFLERYVDIVAKKSQSLLEIMLNAGVDLILRRGWYESTDFWSPQLYHKFLFEPLKKEIDMAHQAGAKYAYIMNSGITPLTACLKKLKLDMLTNIEPEKNDMLRIKKEIGAQIALCGGVNNYNIIEKGSEEEVELAVKEAINLYGKNGGFILAPSDSILDTSVTAQGNFYKMIDTWKEVAGKF